MKSPIYYPTFEVEDTTWLKFALLYLESLQPIVPPSGEAFLSRDFKMLRDESDFLRIYPPNPSDAISPSIDALEEVEKILRNPGRYASLFGGADFLDHWKSREGQDRLLFEEKFTREFREFVLREGLASDNSRGVELSRELADLYMSVFAHSLCESTGQSPITDRPAMDRYGHFTRSVDPRGKVDVAMAKCAIDVAVPKGLSQVPLAEILKLRSSQGFAEKQRAFHLALNEYHEAVERGSADQDFFRSQGTLLKDLSDDLVGGSMTVLSVALSTWVSLHAPDLNTPSALAAAFGAGSSATGAIVSFRNSWKTASDRRLTRKYLADLKRLNA